MSGWQTRDPSHVGLDPVDYSGALPFPKLNAAGTAFEPDAGPSGGGSGLYYVVTGRTTAAVQAELDVQPDGTTLFFPADDYDFTGGSINVHDRSGLTLLGAGYGAVLDGAVTAPVVDVRRSDNITIRTLRLRGDGVAGGIAKTGVSLRDGCDDVHIDGCFIHAMGYDGIYSLVSGATGRRLRITNNTIWDCDDDGINPGGGPSSSSGAVEEVIITGNTVRGIASKGIHVSLDAINVVVSNNTVTDCGEGCLSLARSEAVLMSGNVFGDSPLGVSTEAPGSGSPVIRDVTILGNVIRNVGYGIDVQHASEGWLIESNQIVNAATQGIRVANLTDSTIRDNRLPDSTIVQGSSCSGLIVEANRVASTLTVSGDTVSRLNRVGGSTLTFPLGSLDDVAAGGATGDVLTRQPDGSYALAPVTVSDAGTHRLVVLSDFGTGLEPVTDADGLWLYGAYPGVEF